MTRLTDERLGEIVEGGTLLLSSIRKGAKLGEILSMAREILLLRRESIAARNLLSPTYRANIEPFSDTYKAARKATDEFNE